jgi:preprotein translocase subunit SecF
MRLFANANYEFIGLRRITYLVSATALVIGLGAALVFQITKGSWLNYGVDFAGGALLEVNIKGAPSEGEVRSTANSAVPGSTVSSFGGAERFAIKMPGTGSDVATGPADEVLTALRTKYGANNVERVRVEEVGAKVGSELQSRALFAILISFAAILIYLAFRFEWRFGVAAVIATAHDIMFTLGFIALLRIEVSLTTVAAVLTILGYSLNDTIVVFDRVRENLRIPRRPDFATLLNRSINETLPRTVLTGMTTLATLICLLLFGDPTIRDLALILIVGIVVGTYSSIFVGSPILLEIEKRFPHEQPTVKRQRTTPRPSRVG